MIDIKNFSGFMNLDDPNDVIPQSHHSYAMNITFRGNGERKVAKNINGNQLVTNSLPAGENQCIGAIFDDVRHRVYYFNYNSNGSDGIYYYDTLANTITPLLISGTNSNVPLFSFNPAYPIASINIVYKDAGDGDELHWTDRNNRPMYLNVKDAVDNTIYSSGTRWLPSFLTVARQMPLTAPTCSYGDDNTKTINNLKSCLYQFRYRWVYRDKTKSTWSPYSKLIAPPNVDSLSTDTNLSNNNYISVSIVTGDQDCQIIEIAARNNLSDTFSNNFSIISLDKTKLTISDNDFYTFQFYNDGVYQYVDESESVLLFDYVPKKANAQELINGNVKIYGGITEGYDFNTRLDIDKTVTLVSNSSLGMGIASTDSTFYYHPSVGVIYSFVAKLLQFSGSPNNVVSTTINVTITGVTKTVTVNYTSGYTLAQYVAAITAAIISSMRTTVFPVYARTNYSNLPYGTNNITNTQILIYADNDDYEVTDVTWSINSSSYVGDVNTAVYKHNSKYTFGMVYFDEYGVTNGVVTSDDLIVSTPEAVSSGIGSSNLSIPNIQFSVNHQAPSWARYFSFVRTNNLTVASFKTIATDSVFKDTNYGWMDITSFQTNKDGYAAYSFNKGDRVRIFAIVGTSITSIYDTAVIEMTLAQPSGASWFPSTGFFLKVAYNSTLMSGWSTTNTLSYYIEVYTPAKSASTDLQTFYEFGETYPISVVENSFYYHTSPTQSQTSTQPAIFNFYRGDIYQRKRGVSSFFYILDQSVSDKYLSEVVGNGRPFVIDPYAKEIYNSTLVRYSGTYQQGTLINDLNRFYPINYDEYDRQKGDIQRLKIREKSMRVFQDRGVGVVNVYATEMSNQDGSSNLIGSVKIINPINYYQGEYGMGGQYCSLVSSSSADYYVDPIKGYHIRLARDGNTALTETYKAQYYLPQYINKYSKTDIARTNGGYAKILGFYDDFEEEYVSVFQSGTGLEGFTIGFDEKENHYKSFYSYEPEWAVCAENTIISFSGGRLFTHDNTAKNTFYGTYTPSKITFVFNDKNFVKKTFNYLMTDGNDDWAKSTGATIATSLGQASNLVSNDFEVQEGLKYSAFYGDTNSLGGLVNGDYLKGTWLQIQLLNNSTNDVNLSKIVLGYTPSGRNF
jgi:hypothetical protein